MAIGKSKIKYSDQRLFLFDSVNFSRFVDEKLLTVTANGGNVKLEVWNGTGTGDPAIDTEWEENSDDSPLTSNALVYVGGSRIRLTPTGGAEYIWGG